MLSRVNVAGIVIAHLRTLRKLGRPGINTGDLWLFFWWPAIVALPLAFFSTEKLGDRSSDLLTAVSIIGGFLFGLLAMISGVIDKVKKEGSDNAVKKVFAREVHANIAFGILQSLTCVVLLISYGFSKPTSNESKASTPSIEATKKASPGQTFQVKTPPATSAPTTIAAKKPSPQVVMQLKTYTMGLSSMIPAPKSWQGWILLLMAWANYAMLLSFLLTLLMIINRIFVIMSSDADELLD